MSKPIVLQLGQIEHAHDTWASLAEVAQIIKPKATNRAEFLEECKSGALDGVKAIYRTFASVHITGRIDAELIAALPASVGFICHNGEPPSSSSISHAQNTPDITHFPSQISQ
ncbi:hypothetical protein COL5a_003922 [Colletotrichum fioriniae]|nr:hypothetical protein COL5a_003922 [Colletotrichum fioriniae]